MPSSLFPKQPNNSLLAAVGRLRSMGNPQAAYEHIYQTDPTFRQFADSMKGKTPDQAFEEHGLDYSQVRGLFR